MSSFPTLIVDDHDTRIQYLCPVNKQTVSGSYFHNTWTTISTLACGQSGGFFKHVFNGTRTRIWGFASKVNQNYRVKIDDGPFVLQSGDGYYESPVLPDGLHTVVYAAGNTQLFPSFDYLTITAGPSTQLLGETVIVDDAEIEHYKGNWSTQVPPQFVPDRSSSMYLNTTHWTNTVGDTFTFEFTGNSVAVFGVLPNMSRTPTELNSSATYTVDGISTVLPIPKGMPHARPMTLFFQLDVAAGLHTFVFNVTEVAPSHIFGIDFVVYNSTVETTPVGSTVQPNTSSTTATHKKSHRTSIIVGATLGAFAFALVLLAVLCYCRRRQRTQKPKSTWDVVTKKAKTDA